MRVRDGFLAAAIVAAASCSGQEATSTESRGQSESSGSVAIFFTTDPVTPRMGDNTIEVMLSQDGQPVNDAQVSVEFFMAAMPQMNMAEMRTTADLAPAGDGRYRGTGQVMMAGNWDVTIMARRNGQELGTRTLTVTAK